MSTAKVNIDLPLDVLYEIKSLPTGKISVNERLQLNLAIGLFVSKEVSLAKAAEIAGIALVKFIEILKELQIPSLNYTLDMLEDDLCFVNDIQIKRG